MDDTRLYEMSLVGLRPVYVYWLCPDLLGSAVLIYYQLK